MRLPFVAALLLAACLPAEITTVVPTPLDDDLVFVRGGGGNSLVLVRGGRALVYDPKMWPWAGAIDEVLREHGAQAELLVNSHLHFDHVQANRRFPGVPIFAAPATLVALSDTCDGPRLPRPAGAPTMAVAGRTALNFAGERVELLHAGGPAHTAGDLALWLPARRVLATGDLFDHGYYPHIVASDGGRMTGYLASLERLAALNPAVVLPGHGAAATGADLAAYRDFLRALRDSVVRERATGASATAIVEKLGEPAGEALADLGGFSSRRAIVEAFLAEL
jgi:cyclase